MAEENASEIKEVEYTCGTNTQAMSEEVSMETGHVTDVGTAEDVMSMVSKGQAEIMIPEINEVPKPHSATLRRQSTGTIGRRASKPQVQSRYRGNHHVGSIHDLCKHGKTCAKDDAVKPWKMVRKKSVESSNVIKVETSSLTKKSLAVRRIACASSVNSDCSSKEGCEIARSVDGSSVKSNDRSRKSKETENSLSGSAVVKKFPRLKNENLRASGAGSSKMSAPKNVEKAKSQIISSEDVKEKTVCVVVSSVKSFQSETKTSSEKTTMRSVTTPKRGSTLTDQILGKISTDSTKKKETGSVDLEANPKPGKKVSPKKAGVKVLTFKKGKVLEPKSEGLSPRWIKFRKRVVQELKTQTDGKKRSLKDKRSSVESKTDSCEGSKREKVVLRHQKVEEKKKKMTLLNNVIEETVNKLTKVRKDKVKALIGAFETVISLQDTKTSHKAQTKATTSASKVRPLVSQ